MKINHHHTIGMLALIFLVIIVGYCLMLQSPLAQSTSLKNQHHALMKKWHRYQRQYTTNQHLQTQFSNTIKRHQNALLALAQPLTITTWLQHVSALATQRSVRLKTIQPIGEKTQHAWVTHSFNFVFTGRYFNLLQFIRQLIQPPYTVAFSTLILTPHSPHTLQCHAHITVYHHE